MSWWKKKPDPVSWKSNNQLPGNDPYEEEPEQQQDKKRKRTVKVNEGKTPRQANADYHMGKIKNIMLRPQNSPEKSKEVGDAFDDLKKKSSPEATKARYLARLKKGGNLKEDNLSETSEKLRARYRELAGPDYQKNREISGKAMTDMRDAKTKEDMIDANKRFRPAARRTYKRPIYMAKSFKAGTVQEDSLNEDKSTEARRKRIASAAKKQRLEYIYRTGKLPPIVASGGVKSAKERKSLETLVKAMEIARGKSKKTASKKVATTKKKPASGLPTLSADTVHGKEVLSNIPKANEPVSEPAIKIDTQFATPLPAHPKPGRRYSSYEEAMHDFATSGSEDAMNAAKALAMSEFSAKLLRLNTGSNDYEFTSRAKNDLKLILQQKLSSIEDISKMIKSNNITGKDVDAPYEPRKALSHPPVPSRPVHSIQNNTHSIGLFSRLKRKVLGEERKVSAKIVDSFLAKKKAKEKNSHTDGQAMYLHGNKIAWHGEGGKVHATLAGWGTKTTRERLNALSSRVGGKSFHQKKNTQHYGDKPINADDVVDLN